MPFLQNHKDNYGPIAHQWKGFLLTPKHPTFKDISDVFPQIRFFFPGYVTYSFIRNQNLI